MAFDCFLQIDGIPGESTDDKHKDWIEVISYHHGLSQPSSGRVSDGGGRTSERCNHSNFTIEKSLDKASPKLALHCCNGKHIPKITVELCRAAEDKQKYMQYILSDVIVASVTPGGSASNDDHPLPIEEIGFSYGKIEWVYTETDHKTGKAKGDIKAHWDLSANKGG